MEGKQDKFDLEGRLVDVACACLEVCDILPATKAGQNLEFYLSKSSTASALIYGEAQAAESKADFILKMKMVLKEIRESRVNLKIIKRKTVVVNEKADTAFNEASQLMAIFLKVLKLQREILLLIKSEPQLYHSLFIIYYFLFLL